MTTQDQNKAMVQRILSEGDARGAGILDEVCTPWSCPVYVDTKLSRFQ